MSEVQGSGRDSNSNVHLRRALPQRTMKVLMGQCLRKASEVDCHAPIQDEIRQVKAFARKKSMDAVEATPGAAWNPCCGLGVPNGRKLHQALRKVRSSVR